jgi:glycosyltransferase involved in cell wall biosynthesis
MYVNNRTPLPTVAQARVVKETVSSLRRRYLVTRTVSFGDTDPWGDGIEVVSEAGYLNRIANRLPRWLQRPAYKWLPIQFALKLIWLSRGCSGVAVGRYGMWFPVFRKLLGLPIRVVLTDIEWHDHESGWLNRRAALASDVVCSNTRAEIERYSQRFRIPPEKFTLVRLAFQKRDMRPTSDQGYIFAGGLQGRDWKTLLQAVEGLPYPVRIYTQHKFDGLPANVTVTTTNREGYYDAMAAASCVVVPLLPEKMRITGTTTFSAAMGMGKVVIVTEPYGAPDYMENGVSGFYVNYGDASGVRKCIIRAMQDPRLRAQIGTEARSRAWAEFSPEAFRKRVLALLDGITTCP